MTNETGSRRKYGHEQPINTIKEKADGRYWLCYELEATLASRVRAFITEHDVAGDFREMTRRGSVVASLLDDHRHIAARHDDSGEMRVMTGDLLQQIALSTACVSVNIDHDTNTILERLTTKYPSATFSSLMNAGLYTYLEFVALKEGHYSLTLLSREGETSDLRVDDF